MFWNTTQVEFKEKHFSTWFVLKKTPTLHPSKVFTTERKNLNKEPRDFRGRESVQQTEETFLHSEKHITLAAWFHLKHTRQGTFLGSLAFFFHSAAMFQEHWKPPPPKKIPTTLRFCVSCLSQALVQFSTVTHLDGSSFRGRIRHKCQPAASLPFMTSLLSAQNEAVTPGQIYFKTQHVGFSFRQLIFPFIQLLLLRTKKTHHDFSR